MMQYRSTVLHFLDSFLSRGRLTTLQSGARVIRAGFTKAVQEILEQDQTGFKQLLIQDMAELKLEDSTDPAEVQDPSGSIQFSSIDQGQVGLIISTFSLGSSVPIDPDMGEVGQDQVAINAQLLAANDEFRASLRAITEQLSQVHQRDRPNGPRRPARYQPDLESDADSTDKYSKP
ncbi:hypothetical protein F2Q70_00039345 [Brassica cretica]|uniref:Uncharacterized protein n=2 Tax=Brassica cretica TaxID=69181 RepID=A0A8S9K5E3_BRACR|nr:hypothetical protein F2Q70_00039345 [Brassica cretica]